MKACIRIRIINGQSEDVKNPYVSSDTKALLPSLVILPSALPWSVAAAANLRVNFTSSAIDVIAARTRLYSTASSETAAGGADSGEARCAPRMERMNKSAMLLDGMTDEVRCKVSEQSTSGHVVR